MLSIAGDILLRGVSVQADDTVKRVQEQVEQASEKKVTHLILETVTLNMSATFADLGLEDGANLTAAFCGEPVTYSVARKAGIGCYKYYWTKVLHFPEGCLVGSRVLFRSCKAEEWETLGLGEPEITKETIVEGVLTDLDSSEGPSFCRVKWMKAVDCRLLKGCRYSRSTMFPLRLMFKHDVPGIGDTAREEDVLAKLPGSRVLDDSENEREHFQHYVKWQMMRPSSFPFW